MVLILADRGKILEKIGKIMEYEIMLVLFIKHRRKQTPVIMVGK